MYTKPRNKRTASRKITRGFADYSEQVVFQPALHSRILYTKPRNMRTASRKKFITQKRPHEVQAF